MKAEDYRTIESREVFRGHLVRLRVDKVQRPGGEVWEREVIEHPGAVGVVVITPAREVVLVRQYRHATGKVLTEIPAGLLHPGESPEACALREIEEEVGVRAEKLHLLTSYYTTAGVTNERFHLYLCLGAAVGQARPEDDEELETLILPLERAVSDTLSGAIEDAKTITGLLLADHYLRHRPGGIG